MSKVGVVLVAAGRSSRFGDKAYKKPFAPLLGKSVWLHSAEKLVGRDDVQRVVVVIAAEDREEFDRKYGANLMILGITVCHGGETRADSVAAGIAALGDGIDLIAVHDAARPCVAEKELDAVFEAASRTGAAILASPVASTLKRGERNQNRTVVAETLQRDDVWAAQTPQVFRADWLREAHALADAAKATDDAELVERLGKSVQLVEGSAWNIKITTRPDLKLAEQIIKAMPKPKPKGGNPFAGDDLWR